MEIGIDASRAFGEGQTGIGVYARQVITRLLADPVAPMRLYLNRSGPPENAPPLPGGSEWRCLPMRRGWTAVRLRLELRRDAPSLLWIPAYRLPRGRLPRSVVTVHGVEHRMVPLAYPGRSGQQVESFVQDALRRASRLISPSETTKADLVHHFGADPALVTVIPHGVSSEFHPLPEAERLTLLAEIKVEPPYFLMAGAHHPRKNLEAMLRRFAAAFAGLGAGPSLIVTNAPTGATAPAGATSRVSFLGHVSGRWLAALYGQALGVLVPSLYEGFGLPALEAMACRAPVLASDVGGVQEVAAGAALLVGADDDAAWVRGLQRLFEDEELRSHLSALGEARAARFSWEQSAREHGQLLRRELELARG